MKPQAAVYRTMDKSSVSSLLTYIKSNHSVTEASKGSENIEKCVRDTEP